MWAIILVVMMNDGTITKHQLEWVSLSSTKTECTVKRLSINVRHNFKTDLAEVIPNTKSYYGPAKGEDYKEYMTKCVDLSE